MTFRELRLFPSSGKSCYPEGSVRKSVCQSLGTYVQVQVTL